MFALLSPGLAKTPWTISSKAQTPDTSLAQQASQRWAFEGRVRRGKYMEWSGWGQNTAVGCNSVSRSNGWALALFVLRCHMALTPAWALMRGGTDRRARTPGLQMQVICHRREGVVQGPERRMEVMEIEEKDWRMREQENRSQKGRKGQNESQKELKTNQK